MVPGEMTPGREEIIINEGRNTYTLKVTNTGDRAIQVGSHFHFFEVNKALKFDREKAYGTHLDIASGTSVRFEPGEEKEVIDEVEKFYQDHQDSRYRGVRSTKNLFEFLEPHVSKSFGIERIAKNYGCTLENVCVFGDELNDLEMIRDCGVGVCMANGNLTVKEIANYVTGSNNEDGIAEFIDKYLVKK